MLTEDTFHVPETDFSIPVRTVGRMGWKRDLPDFRDRVLAFPEAKTTGHKAKVDLRPDEHFLIYNQGALGSCTANALGAAFHFDQIKQGVKDFTPSRLFIYFNERQMEGTVDTDSGASLRDGIKSLHKIGVCKETTWPYQEDAFTKKPGTNCYKEAAQNRALEYARVPQTLGDMKGCLSEGYPFVFGFTVLSSFQTLQVAKTGEMSMPQRRDHVLGGHAVCCVGYDDTRHGGCMIVRNSWGTGWGDKGYFYMPYQYITHPYLAQDFWAIRSIEGSATLPVRTSVGEEGRGNSCA